MYKRKLELKKVYKRLFGKLKKIKNNLILKTTNYLPLGWGDIPFQKIFSTFSFSSDIFLNFELSTRYKRYYQSNYEYAKKLILLMK